MYSYLLLPGRHQAVTDWQMKHMQALRQRDDVADDVQVIWAITSANHGGTRHNPLSGSRRLGMVEAVVAEAGLSSQVYRITNMRQKPDFAHYVIESIHLDSKGRLELTPENTLVVTSTDTVAAQYRQDGYTVEPAEANEDFTEFHAPRAWDAVDAVIAAGRDWAADTTVQELLHPACLAYYQRYGLGDDIVDIFDDELLKGDDGDITTSRDYVVYRQAFEDGAKRKLADFEQYVQPGRIMDVGCATGETIKLLAEQSRFFESDFYGVEVARPLYQICQQRKDAGEFGNANTFFYQRNIMQESFFAPNSLDTVITMALTHEVESYLGHDELKAFLKRMYDLLAPGGVYINYDVVAPDDKEKRVYVQFRDDDGQNPAELYPESGADDQEFLRGLSTKARFQRFVNDFRYEEGDGMSVDYQTVEGQEYAVMRYADLCDFLAKKDYVNSWRSEMHERFCFWETSEWLSALKETGFDIDPGTEAKTNQWLIENRFAPAADVYEMKDGALVSVPPPVTNILAIAKKPV